MQKNTWGNALLRTPPRLSKNLTKTSPPKSGRLDLVGFNLQPSFWILCCTLIFFFVLNHAVSSWDPLTCFYVLRSCPSHNIVMVLSTVRILPLNQSLKFIQSYKIYFMQKCFHLLKQPTDKSNYFF